LQTSIISASNANGGTGTLVPGAANFVLELRQTNGDGSTLLDTKTVAVTISNLPSPVLALKNFDPESDVTTFNLTVTNRSVYPNSLFNPSPSLPPCGANTSAARTWVDIYDGTTNAYIYGFCSLGSSSDLDGIWFSIPASSTLPASVYIKMTDRLTGNVYTSNTISLNTTPVLALKSIVDNGTGRTYNMTVTNRSIYSDQMFAQFTGGCSSDQTTSSRTYVDIYEANTGNRLYGFCQFGLANDLDGIWLFVPSTSPKPSGGVYIRLNDRKLNHAYQSNAIATP
jgi:hypothetical protein